MPIAHSSLLNTDLSWTDAEYAVGKKYLKWEEVTLNWEDVDLTWDEVFILLEVAAFRRGGGAGRGEYERGNPWRQVSEKMGHEKTQALVKLYCRVGNKEYQEEKEIAESVRITVNEFDRFVNEALVKVGFGR